MVIAGGTREKAARLRGVCFPTACLRGGSSRWIHRGCVELRGLYAGRDWGRHLLASVSHDLTHRMGCSLPTGAAGSLRAQLPGVLILLLAGRGSCGRECGGAGPANFLRNRLAICAGGPFSGCDPVSGGRSGFPTRAGLQPAVQICIWMNDWPSDCAKPTLAVWMRSIITHRKPMCRDS